MRMTAKAMTTAEILRNTGVSRIARGRSA